ncbi:MAG TPA: hypothetical protein VLG37_04675 [Candidatus Saccharimonadales bacterium]|nr:hypothetical protein [Candidatus Saccharimonadales bacterium]
MQPQQIYVPPPKGQNPYDFIVNPAKPPKRSLLNGGTSLATRLLLAAAGLFILVILVAVVLRFFNGGSGTSSSSLLSLAQTQNELIRVSDAGFQAAKDPSTKNLAITAKLGLQSDQQELVNYLKTHGTKVTANKLGLLENKTTDQRLAAALSAGNYDSTFRNIMQSSLNSYSAALSRTYSATKNKATRQLLSDDYKAAQLLISQSQQQS